MRILFLTHRLPFAPNRGDRIRAFHVLQHLRRHASVTVLSLVHDVEEERAVESVPAADVHVVRSTPWRNRMRAAVAWPTSVPLTHALLDAPELQGTVDRVARACRPDVVLAFCSGMAKLALLPTLRQHPAVLDMVDVDSAKWAALATTSALPLAWVYRREARTLAKFETAIVRHAVATLVVNEKEHRTLSSQVPGADIRIVPNGVDVNAFRRPDGTWADPGPVVVFCGVMNYQPNEEAALRLMRTVWPAVRRHRPDARLVILGAHPTAAVRDLAERDSSIEVTGAVPDVRPYLWRAAVSIAPLTTARGLQNKVLEALAADLPVVTTPAVADGLPRPALAGCIVTRDELEAASAVVSLLARDSGERRAFARRADLGHLSWASQLAPLIDLLEQAAHTREGASRLAS